MAVGHGLSNSFSSSSSSSNGVAGVRAFDPAKHRPEAHIPGGESLLVLLALSVGSRRLPGMNPGQVLPIASVRCGITPGAIEL